MIHKLAALLAATALAAAAPAATTDYLFVWASDVTAKKADFLAVIDTDPASPRYTEVAALAGLTAPTPAESSVLDSVESTWAESVVLGGVDAPGPTVTVGVTTFADPSDAADVVQNADQLAVPLANQEAVEGAALENADSVRAFRFTSPNAAAPDAVDSYRIIFATGATLTVIDVQGASSDQVATDAAMALAQAQLGCQTGGPCDLPQLPADLTGGA